MSYRNQRRQLVARLGRAKSEVSIDTKRVRDLETDLKVLKSDRLWRRANRWGISNRSEIGPWETNSDLTLWWLNSDNRLVEAKKVIDNAKHTYIKKWVDLLSPILSVIISILAFLLAALALYLQFVGRIH